MEKLIELLNEYEKEKKSDLYYKFELEDGELYCYDDVTDVLWTMQDEAMVVCSKKFGFIKWLVENDKIDYQKSPGEIMFDDRMGTTFSLEDSIIMMLSISDTPIDDLISYLY